VADVLARLERGVAARRGAAVVFLVALAVYGLQSVALPVIPGRDFGTYLRFYVQMFDWASVLPMSMLFRTPVAPLVVGGSLELLGGYGTRMLMALLFAGSIVCWTRIALVFSCRAALLTAAALLLYPGYGILFHMLASDSICALVFALWALVLTRAWLEPSPGRYAVLGLATAAAALTRPGYQVLAVFALVPLLRAGPRRVRLASAASCLAVVVVLLGAWTVNNGVRYDDYAVARGGGAFFPFYRAFTTDRIVSPENGPASRELADAVRARLLPEEPYRSYRIGLDDFFERGGPREFEDLVGLTDRVWGWDSDYAQLRRAGLEGVRAHPFRYLRGVGATVVDELASPLYVALPREVETAPTAAASKQTVTATTVPTTLPPPSEGEQIPAAHQGFFSTTPDGSIRELWTSATDHGVVFTNPDDQRRFAEVDATANRLDALVPPYPGSRWLTLQFSRSSKLFPPPLLWLAVGLVAWIWRRPARAGLAACIALVVFGAAGLLGERRPTR
jgi:hypothetical protein